ncbi:C1 family peptidase [Sphingopyxis sp.]|uniref:C1 family peptidase n=1 Tax=Sphingopyxis sp. TaxID=1908224 RepID=UPI001DF63FA6|nr:C1 family peptidase [Sphingopyxis sp.]MBW8295430.1 peptidase C1 [Sphingopyxis sp.]
MLTVETDLRPLFGPARDQGQRPTCLAFAASDAHAGLRADWVPLSCEFAFYHAQRRSNSSPLQGATLGSILEALKQDGQPAEEGWPYLTNLPSDYGSWFPPAKLGPIFRRGGSACADALTAIIDKLDRNEPVILLTTLSPSFYAPTINGIVDPADGEAPDPALRHAIIAVGHGTFNGSTIVLIRNSWGQAWGINGYAWLTERFLTPRLFATASLLEDVDVFTDPVTT